MNVYMTKYALTQGIYIIEDVEVPETKYRPGEYIWKPGYGGFWKPDWHEDKESAIKDAERRRAKAIEAAKRKIEKLESLVIKFIER